MDALTGSVVTMDQYVRPYREFDGCFVADMLRAVAVYLADILEIADRKGVVGERQHVDLVFLDYKLEVVCTWDRGWRCIGRCEC